MYEASYTYVSTNNYIPLHNIRSPVLLTPIHLRCAVKLDIIVQPIMVPLKLSASTVNRILDVGNTATSNKPGLDSELDLILTLKTADPLTIGAAWHGACPAILTRNCARR
jgi:hypothetical protein